MNFADITLPHYLTLGGILFALSVIGIFLNRRNLIVLLMARSEEHTSELQSP